MPAYFRKKYFLSIVLGFVLCAVFPFSLSAAPTEETKNGNTGITYECAGNGNCDFGDLIAATEKAVNWGVTFALAFSVVVIAWAGFKMMISGDSSGERTKAKNMLFSVAKGLVFVIAAWLIVSLIMNTLVKTKDPNNNTSEGVPLLIK